MSALTPPVTPRTPSFPNTSSKYQTPSAVAKNSVAPLLTPPYTPEHRPVESGHGLNRLSIGSTISSLSDSEKITESSRLLSDNELSYYLPSRADGVNDMYLHHSVSASADHMDPERILYLWAYQLLRHPLLAAHLRSSSYEAVSFVHPNPSHVYAALISADDRFIHVENPSVDIIDAYLNGPRTLSNERLSMLIVSDKDEGEYEVMLCATHFVGDGMALHTFMNEFYTLLGSDKSISNFSELIQAEINVRHAIPTSLEDRLPTIGNGSRIARTIGAVDNRRNDAKLVGGQSFPSSKTKKERRTVVPTFAYTEAETKTILGKCKANGVTIAHAMFALCNIAWARRTESREAPCLIYSALNLRTNMIPSPDPASYFHLAVGYFNIVLPSVLPTSLSTSELFWHRCKSTKLQTTKAVKSPFVVARSRETNRIRRGRAVKWAEIDDQEAKRKKEASVSGNAGLGLGLGIVEPTHKIESAKSETPEPKFAPLRDQLGTPVQTPMAPSTPFTPPTPSRLAQRRNKVVLPPVNQRALMGVSMLGNLDGMYAHKTFSEIRLKSLTTGSRQRPGGLLLFAYTFAGKLWMSLGYDVNGFEPGSIEGFWEEVQGLAREVLL